MRPLTLCVVYGGAACARYCVSVCSGLLDPMVLMTAFPDIRLASVAKHSLFQTPLVSLFLDAMETVPVAQQYDVGLPAHKQPTAQERARMNAQVRGGSGHASAECPCRLNCARGGVPRVRADVHNRARTPD